ncbi:MAG: tetratricopeptide repeat-containing sensor histidine kinase [Chitinophagaceae bacterium]
MKYLLLTFLITLFLQHLYAQNKKIDSINNLIANAKTDTARINLLNEKARVYTENNLDSAINISSTAIEKAKQIQYQKGEANAYNMLGIALTYKGSFALAAANYKAAEQIYRQTADSEGLNKLYRGYGMYYGMQSKYDSSIIFFKKNIEFDERNNKQKDLSSAYQNVAVSYTMLSNYQQALFYQSKALKLAENMNDTSALAYVNLNMAISYSNVSDYERCEELNLKAIKYAQQAHIKNVELYGYANLSSNCSMLSRYQETYDYAMKAVNLGKQLGDYAIVASSLSRAGTALASQKKFAEAEKITAQAIHIADSVGAPLNIYQTHADMGFIKKEEQQYADAIKYYEKGFASLKGADIYDTQIGDSYNGLSEAYEKSGMYDKALAAFKTAKKIGDSLKSRENIRRATEVSMNYAFDKKQQAAKIEQDKKNAIANARQLALMIGVGCMALLIIGAIFAYRNKQKANLILQSQKDKLQQALIELKITQTQLIHSEKMASLGELTAGIAHEIQNPLNFVNNFSEINTELIDELQNELKANNTENAFSISTNIKENEQKITHHGKRADAIVKGMLQHSRKNTGVKEPTDINALADEYLRLSYHGLRAKDKNFNADFKTDFDESIGKINIVSQDIGRVFLNLFNNAFYAVNEKKKNINSENYQPTVSIQTKKINNKIEIVVKDNGNGIPQNVVHKIFQPFFTTKPTGQGTGLGLSLSYDIITKEHSGQIKAETREGEFTEFIIQLPI